jgi:hypothetical protein
LAAIDLVLDVLGDLSKAGLGMRVSFQVGAQPEVFFLALLPHAFNLDQIRYHQTIVTGGKRRGRHDDRPR